MVKKFLMTAAAGLVLTVSISSCVEAEMSSKAFRAAPSEVKLVTLDLGHLRNQRWCRKKCTTGFRPRSTSLILTARTCRIISAASRRRYNTRADDPTSWKEVVYTGPDFLEKMLCRSPATSWSSPVITRRKTEYIPASVEAGLNVLSDKPMASRRLTSNCSRRRSHRLRPRRAVLLYDIMTERYGDHDDASKGAVAYSGGVRKAAEGHAGRSCDHQGKRAPFLQIRLRQSASTACVVLRHHATGRGHRGCHHAPRGPCQWGPSPVQAIDAETDVEMLRPVDGPPMITGNSIKKVTRLDDFPPT